MKEIRKTKSVCPKCLAKIDAKQVEIGNRLYLIKKCKTHGIFKTLISKDSRNYKRINNFYSFLFLYLYMNNCIITEKNHA